MFPWSSRKADNSDEALELLAWVGVSSASCLDTRTDNGLGLEGSEPLELLLAIMINLGR